jgi:hypothetical protein
MRTKIIAPLIFSLLLFFIAVPSFAQDSDSTTDSSSTITSAPRREAVKNRIQNVRETTQERIETTRENTKARLDEARLKACEARESAINKRIEMLGRLSTNILTKFSNITDRVVEFYNNKMVTEGKTLSNYNELIANINTEKEAVANALSVAQGTTFSCDSDDPKGQLEAFRDNMKNVKAALQEYRSSIKDLIVAVKSLNSEQETTE